MFRRTAEGSIRSLHKGNGTSGHGTLCIFAEMDVNVQRCGITFFCIFAGREGGSILYNKNLEESGHFVDVCLLAKKWIFTRAAERSVAQHPRCA